MPLAETMSRIEVAAGPGVRFDGEESGHEGHTDACSGALAVETPATYGERGLEDGTRGAGLGPAADAGRAFAEVADRETGGPWTGGGQDELGREVPGDEVVSERGDQRRSRAGRSRWPATPGSA